MTNHNLKTTVFISYTEDPKWYLYQPKILIHELSLRKSLIKTIILYIKLGHNLDQTQTRFHITQQKRELRLKLIRFIIYLGLLIRPLYIIKSYFNNI